MSIPFLPTTVPKFVVTLFERLGTEIRAAQLNIRCEQLLPVP